MAFPRRPDEEDIVNDYIDGVHVPEIMRRHNVGTSTLYTILDRHQIPLRGNPHKEITVMDPISSTFMQVKRTTTTLALRAEQVARAYQSGELVRDILRKWDLNTKQLYRIVSPNRYSVRL